LPAQEILQNHVSPPVAVHKTSPEYTQEAWDAKLEGAVRLQAIVGIDGTLSEIKIVRGLGKGLDEKAVECLQQWRFKPGLKYAVPVPVTATFEVTFRPLQSRPASK